MADKITSDWAEVFPDFSVWRSLHLLRRIGPVVQGVILDKSTAGDQYYPTVHIHSLAQDFPVISLTLAQRLVKGAGVQESIDVGRHSEGFRSAAARLESQSELPLRSVPELTKIVGLLRKFAVAAQKGRLPEAVPELEGSVLVPAASENPEDVEESLKIVEQVSARWSGYESPSKWADTRDWLDWLRASAADGPGLVSVVEGQIAKHGLGEIRSW
ncbi:MULTISPECIES: hypothetical protein [unclassified Streptomyces]|uniref:hypothetical protein n=1 Tax=unclassified Streptomyces TaxID=2593676 RepID=UPI00365D9995